MLSLYKAAHDYGWSLAIVVGLLMAVFATYVRPAAPVIDPLVGIFRSPAEVVCPVAWTETSGKDPDSGLSFKTCTSPEQRYVLTFRQGQEPVGLDTVARLFLAPEDIDRLLQ